MAWDALSSTALRAESLQAHSVGCI
jgi:hypothetical protein